MSFFKLVVNDLHVGGMFGLFPRNFRISTGSILPLNSGQQYLLECWESIVDRLPETIDVLVLNGDIVEGRNKFVMSKGLSEVDELWQVRAAHEVLKPVAEKAKVILATRGSAYHTGKGGINDERVGEKLGARTDGFGRYARPWWRYYFPCEGGMYFDTAHRQSYMIRYRSTAMEREMDFALARFAKMGQAPPSYIVVTRSHTHVGYLKFEQECGVSISTPAMKLQDDYAQTGITPNRTIPDNLGALGYHVYKEDSGAWKLEIEPFLFKHPDIGAEVIDMEGVDVITA